MPLHNRVVAALRGSDKLSPVSKADYITRLTALQRITGHGLKRVLLEPEQSLHAMKSYKCTGSGRKMAATTQKAYVAAVLSAMKHCEILHTRPGYRRARRAWSIAFKQLRDQVDTQYRRLASGEALPNRCDGYVAWSELCRVRDSLAMGTVDRLILELYSCALGRSREYAAVRLFRHAPSKELRRRYPNYCLLHPHDPAGSYLRVGDFKTHTVVGPYKVRLTASLHQAIVCSLQQQPRQYLFEQPSNPGEPFSANSWSHYCRRRLKAIFGKPVTSCSIRHSYVNSLNLNSHSELQHAARRLTHTSVDTLKRWYVWGAFKGRQHCPTPCVG